jgi:alkanesulfonate monooxygenase SsuD/methylene tetrahydromethanopterin reductase-like flavin-dependent oxidoreductase (luciferase family)
VKVGAILMYQNAEDYRRFREKRFDEPEHSSQFFRDEIRCGEFALGNGFDSVWSVEHHFTCHGESSAPLQELTYFAGRVPGAGVGTCVVVLPWNDPVRVAEQIAILDNLMDDDAELILGFGRGSAQREYDGFEMELGESTARFRENWEIVKLLLTSENASYQGTWRSFENITTLPRPKSKDLLSRCYYSWGSRNSLEYAAESGFNPIFVPKGTAEDYAKDMAKFNSIRAEHGWDPVQPIVSLCIYCDTDAERAQTDGRRFMREFYETTLDHYQRLDPDHFRKAGNYAEAAEKAEKLASANLDEALDKMITTQIIGTPEQVLSKLRHWREITTPVQLLLCMRFGSMSYADAERNIRVLSEHVLPEVHSWSPALTTTVS